VLLSVTAAHCALDCILPPPSLSLSLSLSPPQITAEGMATTEMYGEALDLMAKDGNIGEAIKLFEGLRAKGKVPCIRCWSRLLRGLGRCSRGSPCGVLILYCHGVSSAC
jgi:hypothetical protein